MTDRSDGEEKRRILDEVGAYVSTPSGRSMRPMLRGERDNILVEKPTGRLKKFDVALYTRRDGTSVLHRVVAVREHDYGMRGDNCDYTEFGITDGDVIGVLTGFWRGDRFIPVDDRRYRRYVRRHHATYPLRWLRIRTGKLIRKIASRIPPLRWLWHKLRRG